jgi:hypothetical protein
VNGIPLIAPGAAALMTSLAMPRFEERQIEPITPPELVPGVIALLITLLGGSGRSASCSGSRSR